MRLQWNLIFSLLFALIVALFAVVNVEPVQVNFLMGGKEIPLIIVILGSALAGGIIVGFYGIFRQYRMNREIRNLKKELAFIKEGPKEESSPVMETEETCKPEEKDNTDTTDTTDGIDATEETDETTKIKKEEK